MQYKIVDINSDLKSMQYKIERHANRIDKIIGLVDPNNVYVEKIQLYTKHSKTEKLEAAE